MRRVFLDLNVVLDVLLERAPWRSEADAIWDAHGQGRIEAMTSAAALPTLFYIVEKHADRGRARTGIEKCLQHLTVVPVDRSIAEVALQGPSTDFEDNLQLACAVRAGAEALITRDPKGFVGSPIPVLSPAELLARMASQAPDAP